MNGTSGHDADSDEPNRGRQILGLGNPLVDEKDEDVIESAKEFVQTHRQHAFDEALFIKAALWIKYETTARYSQAPNLPALESDEKNFMDKDRDHPLSAQTMTLYFTIFLNSIAAAIQGWDQTGTNGANLIWPGQLNLELERCIRKCNKLNELNDRCTTRLWKVGFVNAAPYIMITLIWWASDPLNHWLGRRKTIFIAALFSLIAPLGSATVNTWGQLAACRAMLGIGMGLKEITVPIFSTEVAPARSRGKLVMTWQIWTTLGIFAASLTNMISLAITHDRDRVWRYQLGSAFIPAVPIIFGVLWCPESPRWLYRKGRMGEAYDSLLRLRKHRIQAARDLYFMHIYRRSEAEPRSMVETVKRFGELFTRSRYRRAVVAASVVMAAQQLCGINILSFYSSTIFTTSGRPPNNSGCVVNPDQTASRFRRDTIPDKALARNLKALGFSTGYAAVTFIFALPAIRIIDRFGRRILLLCTIPAMSLFLLIAGQMFRVGPHGNDTHGKPEAHGKPAVVTFLLMFAAFYAPGLGPIPFTYSSEVFPQTHREIGMGWAVAVNNFWGALLALSFPYIFSDFNGPGTLGFFSAMNVVAFILIFFFVAETREMSLESLDFFFDIDKFTRKYIDFNFFRLGRWYYRRYVLRAGSDGRKPEFPGPED